MKCPFTWVLASWIAWSRMDCISTATRERVCASLVPPQATLSQLAGAGNAQTYRIQRRIGGIQEQSVIVYIPAELLDLRDRTPECQRILHS